jgi:guanylate kinase
VTLIILAGPAGVGKGTLVRWILENSEGFSLSVSATTRSPRPGEIEGIHYNFVDKPKFEQLITDNQLLEWATVHGDNYYGTMFNELTRAEAEKLHLLLEIDLQGARQVMKLVPEAITFFIQPPSFAVLESRLRERATETESQIQTRLITARAEIAAAEEFDYQLINDDLAQTGKEILKIVSESEREKNVE